MLRKFCFLKSHENKKVQHFWYSLTPHLELGLQIIHFCRQWWPMKLSTGILKISTKLLVKTEKQLQLLAQDKNIFARMQVWIMVLANQSYAI